MSAIDQQQSKAGPKKEKVSGKAQRNTLWARDLLLYKMTLRKTTKTRPRRLCMIGSQMTPMWFDHLRRFYFFPTLLEYVLACLRYSIKRWMLYHLRDQEGRFIYPRGKSSAEWSRKDVWCDAWCARP